MHLDFDWTEFAHAGLMFRARIEPDHTGATPWEDDGHGPVSDWTTRDKRPGEMVLIRDGRHARYYDFAAAVAIAKRDGWNAAPYWQAETRGQRAAKAARADFDRIRAWCNDEWQYVGVVVERIGGTLGDFCGPDDGSLWCIESDAGDYLTECALDLAGEIAAPILKTRAANLAREMEESRPDLAPCYA
jgi:hypothetical protein